MIRSSINIIIDWFKKRRVFPRWRLLLILMWAIFFGMDLQLSIQDGNYLRAYIVAFCGIGFIKEMK